MGGSRKIPFWMVLIVCIGVAVMMAAAGSDVALASAQEADTPEIPFVDGAPVTPAVRPVIVLSGSDYDMGYQHYQQLAQIFGTYPFEAMQRTFTDEELVTLKAHQWYIKEYTPELIEQFKGMAQAATDAGVPLSYAEVLANKTTLTSYPGTEPEGSADDELPPGGCSGFAAWGSTTKDHKLIASGSVDHENLVESYVLVVFPETGNDFVISTFELDSHGSHPGMNDKGLCYVHHGAGLALNEQAGYATCSGRGGTEFYVLHTLRFADNAAQAKQMQLDYPSGARSRGLWADTSGDAFDIESRDPETIRLAGENGEKDFLYATNNSLTKRITPTKDQAVLAKYFGWDIKYVRHGGWTAMDEDAVRRNLLMWNMLHNYRGKVDLEFVKMMWRFPGRMPKYPSLEAADAGMYENQSAGWDSKICALGNATIGICLPDDGDNGLFYTSNGTVSPRANAQCPDYYYFTPGATHTFFEVQLADNPADVVAAAQHRAMYDMAYANIRLRKLTYSDNAFEPLTELFDKAAAQWDKGDYYLGLAEKTTGNESVTSYAKALRGFTACQARANQVYEALAGAADTPTDLGLRKYWGAWGTWSSYLGSH